ncbi:hypothetical protein Q5M85_03940 [Paraclostridium bifermentans]|nr:hypothetical protein [Paraclostridium bifermentans]
MHCGACMVNREECNKQNKYL